MEFRAVVVTSGVGHKCVCFLTASLHQDSFLGSSGVRFLAIPISFVSMFEDSRESKR